MVVYIQRAEQIFDALKAKEARSKNSTKIEAVKSAPAPPQKVEVSANAAQFEKILGKFLFFQVFGSGLRFIR
jgi:hypothetical protein